jgi:glycosyltransferase involved in cell wall biosynthesis
MEPLVTLVGTMPPIKGISDYCIEQIKSLSNFVSLEFYGFKSIYPEYFYPGGKTKEYDKTFSLEKPKNVEIKNFLAWYNPISWIFVGLTSKGKILHFHWWTFWLFPVFFTISAISKLRGKKIVCTVHNVVGHESGLIDKLFSMIIYLIPDKIIVHTKANQKQLENTFHVGNKKINVIPHGIYEFYRDAEMTKSKARKMLGIPKKSKVILMFGNLRPYKGIDDLILAFKKARKIVPNIFLVIAGKPWTKQINDYIIQELSDCSSCLLKLDYVPSSEIKKYFFASDVVVLPYKDFAAQSGPGNIALAFQKPIIVSDTGGLVELVLDKRAVFSSGNSNDLANKISSIISDEKLLKKLEKDSALLSEKYSWTSIAKLTLKVYNELVE